MTPDHRPRGRLRETAFGRGHCWRHGNFGAKPHGGYQDAAPGEWSSQHISSGHFQTSPADRRSPRLLGRWCYAHCSSCHVPSCAPQRCVRATKLSREKQALAQTSPAPSWCVRRSLEPTTRSKHSCCHGMCSQMGPWPTCAPALPLRLCPRAPPRPWMLSKHAS